MPLPHRIAQFNKRYTNWLVEPVMRRLPGHIVVEHHGRRSGRTYQTPLQAFGDGARLSVVLTYGPKADWAQNVQTSGGTVRRRSQLWSIHTAEVQPPGATNVGAAGDFIGPSLLVALRLMRIRHVMVLTIEHHHEDQE